MSQQPTLQQKKELEKLEHAAEEVREPQQIEREAGRTEPARGRKPFWFVPHLTAAAVAAVAIFLLRWDPEALGISHALSETIQRYVRQQSMIAKERALEELFEDTDLGDAAGTEEV